MAHLNNIDNSLIRYANVWEDAAVLRSGLQINPGDRVLSVGSAGDNCFALLLDNPSLVVAADINIVQLHLIELKIAAMKNCNYQEVLFFFGFKDDVSLSRTNIYNKIKGSLSKSALEYWNEKLVTINSGIVHHGKFEKYFQMFAWKVLPLIHNKKTVSELFLQKSAEDQKVFYHKKWNTWRWRFFFRIFFSKKVMGWLGRDPAFLKQVNRNVSDFILTQAEKQLTRVQAQNNFILKYNLTGSFWNLLPDYLENESNFEIIKQRLDRIKLFNGLVEEAGAEHGKFDALNLSDIFEYMNPEIFRKTALSIHALCNVGARVGYWNLMVDRYLSEILPDQFQYEQDSSLELTKMDRGFFYNCFIIDQVK